MKSIITVVSDFFPPGHWREYGHMENNNRRLFQKVNFITLVVPHVLSVSDVHSKYFSFYKSSSEKPKNFYDWISCFEVCMGVELTNITRQFYFTTKARAEVYRDNILCAIDEFWSSGKE